MPKALEDKLRKEASSKGLKGSDANAYIYGTMRDTGWKPKRETRKALRNKRSDSLNE